MSGLLFMNRAGMVERKFESQGSENLFYDNVSTKSTFILMSVRC